MASSGSSAGSRTAGGLAAAGTNPVAFYRGYYERYPALSIPYHPPGVPAALGGWFLVAGVSHESARAFVALCWALAGWLFYRINRELGLGLMSFRSA